MPYLLALYVICCMSPCDLRVRYMYTHCRSTLSALLNPFLKCERPRARTRARTAAVRRGRGGVCERASVRQAAVPCHCPACMALRTQRYRCGEAACDGRDVYCTTTDLKCSLALALALATSRAALATSRAALAAADELAAHGGGRLGIGGRRSLVLALDDLGPLSCSPSATPES